MRTVRLLPLLFVIVVVACVTSPSVHIASQESDSDAKRFAPPQGKSNLYVAWSNSSSSRPISLDLVVDGKTIGPIVPGTFYLVAIDPGRHAVAASARLNSSKATIDTEAGRNYFYEVTVSGAGIGAQPSLGIVLLEEMGKIMVRQNKRAQGLVE